jgi:hypothetical protein
MKQIVPLSNEIAIIEVDKFLWEISNIVFNGLTIEQKENATIDENKENLNDEKTDLDSDEETELDSDEETDSDSDIDPNIIELDDLLVEVDKIKRGIDEKKDISVFDVNYLLEKIDDRINYIEIENQSEELINKTNQLIEENKYLQTTAINYSYGVEINEILRRKIYSYPSAIKIIEELDEIYRKLVQAGNIRVEINGKIIEGKTRAAWYRAKKKIDESSVILAGGKKTKAISKINEAQVLLQQDWEIAFPGEKTPIIPNY